MKPIADLIKSAKRELAIRERVYPRWIGQRMTADQCRHEIECMGDIVEILETLKTTPLQQPQAELFGQQPK